MACCGLTAFCLLVLVHRSGTTAVPQRGFVLLLRLVRCFRSTAVADFWASRPQQHIRLPSNLSQQQINILLLYLPLNKHSCFLSKIPVVAPPPATYRVYPPIGLTVPSPSSSSICLQMSFCAWRQSASNLERMESFPSSSLTRESGTSFTAWMLRRQTNVKQLQKWSPTRTLRHLQQCIHRHDSVHNTGNLAFTTHKSSTAV